VAFNMPLLNYHFFNNLSTSLINIVSLVGDFTMIDRLIDETIFVVKKLDENIQKIAEKQKKLDEKIENLEHAKTRLRKKLLPVLDVKVK
jgi:hypothetical protein